jgi:hypothetical protein
MITRHALNSAVGFVGNLDRLPFGTIDVANIWHWLITLDNAA